MKSGQLIRMTVDLRMVCAVSCAFQLLLAASSVLAQAPPEPPLKPDVSLKKETLGEGIYLFRAPSDLDLWTATNVVAIVNDDDVTVFDSCTRAGTARMVIAEIRKITNKPVTTLINSHWHMDHWSGNDEYVKAFPGLQIISTAQTREYMTRMGAAFFADSIGGGLPRARASLATAIETGKQEDGSDLTPTARARREKDIAETESFAKEMANLPRVLPNLVFHDRLTFWRGRREFRLRSETGDATASTVLYLPAERLLVTGDVLVRPEVGDGPPPWTTNSYAIAGWATSLRHLEALDVAIVVPGQGAAFHDKAYLKLTADLFGSIVAQVHAALERGLVALDAVQGAVSVDSLGLRFTPGATTPSAGFKRLVTTLVRKAYQESLDGARS